MPDAALEASRPRFSARRVGIVLFTLLVVAPLVAVAIISTWLFTPGGPILEVELRATGGRHAQVFWSSDFAMSQENSSLATLHQHPGEFTTLRFALPRKPLEVVRFDPLDGEGEVLIRAVRVLDAQGRTVRTLNPRVFNPLHQIALVKPGPGGVRVVTTPGANDPMLVASGAWFVAEPAWYHTQVVTRFSLTWIALAVLALIVVGVSALIRDIRTGAKGMPNLLWFGALFLAIIWAKLALLDQFPVPVPFWDQWDGEGLPLYIPWPDHGVTWRQMFTYHNEHRIFFSRLLALTVLVINGQWDPHLQIAINAVLHALAGFVFAAALWIALGRRLLPVVALVVLVTFGAPFGIENTLAGFQSAFYFLVLFSALALVLMGTSRPGTPRWFLGGFFALVSPFTVAGGILVLPAIAGASVLGTTAEGWGWRRLAATIPALGVVAAVGYWALPPPVAGHDVLMAGSFQHFALALARGMAFPFINYPRAAVLMWLPIAILGISVVWRRLHSTPGERFALAIGAWVVLQCLAIAYSRGANGVAPASRYLDVVALGYLANTAAILSWLVGQRKRRFAAVVAAMLVSWLVVTGLGLRAVSTEAVAAHGPLRQQWMREYIKNVRQFVVSDDIKAFLDLKGPSEIPYHNAVLLASMLEHPYIRRILPAAVRQPLAIGSPGAAPVAPTSVVRNPQPVFDSYAVGQNSGLVRFDGSPVRCEAFDHLWFELAGSSRWEGVRVALEGDAPGSVVEIRRPWFSPGGWSGVAVRCPPGPFKVVAEDASATSWVAFRAPAEIALGSATVAWLVPRSSFLGYLAVLMAVGAALIAAAQSNRFSDNDAGVSR